MPGTGGMLPPPRYVLSTPLTLLAPVDYCGPGPRFGVGDVVGCGVNYLADGVGADIFFTLNGRSLGVAFHGVSEQLFPVVRKGRAGGVWEGGSWYLWHRRPVF
uniref:SPRY domain-containing protein n=1 Tax=Rhizochromulina marina TaxID=1034831 RepID=A0A7S2RQF8_9STRA|mmetsp:Transcript_19508/g.56916  ORF Transcript_19508/g.56916 Transcript_19508/m.56916 type:complete len:103 (+) Transcript_19508:176-484(+)